MASYLVTGAAGFIASKTVELLLADGHRVHGIDNINNAYDPRLKHWRLERLPNLPGAERFTFEQGDITDRDTLRRLFESQEQPFDGIINLAARAGVRPSVENPWIYFDVNTTGVLNLLELCKDFGVKKFVQASTSSLYGANKEQPFTETQNTDMTMSPYAASKKGAEALCYTYHHLFKIDVTALRFFTVYGPAGRPDMSLFRFVQWIAEGKPVTVFGDGSQSRDFTYVDDIARGIVAALRPVGYEVINLGSDKPHQLMDTIRLIEKLLGKQANFDFRPLHPADVLATWADISKARRLLDWEPHTHVEDGIRNLVEWYQENREWAREIDTEV